jgi:hypothetical protein
MFYDEDDVSPKDEKNLQDILEEVPPEEDIDQYNEE